MANRKRKHGIFAVNSEVVLLSSSKGEEREGMHISIALETIFKQMRIAGNRSRTIQSYEYIFKQFVEVCGIVVVEEIDMQWSISAEHPMTKEHYVSFIALATGDQIQLYKQFPEWALQATVPKKKHGELMWFGTRDGLFYQ